MRILRNYVQCIFKEPEFAFLRYLIVGGWNTVFGIFVYAILYHWYGEWVHYLLLTIPANVLAITNAYIGYKIFVFKTHGQILREYFRCYVVYGVGSLAGMGLLFILVHVAGIHPVYANIIGTGAVVICSYCGHKFFSFRR